MSDKNVIHLYETAHSGYYEDDPTKTVNLVPKTWTKFTVTDGDWKTKYTIKPLSARDEFIADCIENLQSKVKIIQEGNNTTITKDVEGNEYINQHFEPSQDNIKIKSTQGTITATVVKDELTNHTTVTIGLNNGEYNLGTQNWTFKSNLSATNFNTTNLYADAANLANISTLTKLVATNINPVTNLTATNLVNDTFKISTNLSAINLTAKDYIASDSFKITDNATINDISTKPSIISEVGKADNLQLNDTNNIGKTITLNNVTVNYNTTATNASGNKVENKWKTNTTTTSGNNFNVTENLYTTSCSATNATITSGRATNSLKTTNSKFNHFYPTKLTADKFEIDCDFDVLTAKNASTSLSSVLNRGLYRTDIVEGVGVIKWHEDTDSTKTKKVWSTNSKEGYEAGSFNNITNFESKMKEIYQTGLINNFIFRMGRVASTQHFNIPVNLDKLTPFVVYSFYLVNYGATYDGTGYTHSINIDFRSSVNSTMYFFNVPKFHFAEFMVQNHTYLPWIDSNNEIQEIQVIHDNTVTYSWEPAEYKYSWWEHMQLTNLRTSVNTTSTQGPCAVYDFGRISSEGMVNVPNWITIMKNIKFTISVGEDNGKPAYFVYFLNGNNY